MILCCPNEILSCSDEIFSSDINSFMLFEQDHKLFKQDNKSFEQQIKLSERVKNKTRMSLPGFRTYLMQMDLKCAIIFIFLLNGKRVE